MATRATFKGTDRNIIKKMKKTFQMAAARDTRTQNPRRTSSISTRSLMFPASDSALTAAVALVTARLDALLAMTTTI